MAIEPEEELLKAIISIKPMAIRRKASTRLRFDRLLGVIAMEIDDAGQNVKPARIDAFCIDPGTTFRGYSSRAR